MISYNCWILENDKKKDNYIKETVIKEIDEEAAEENDCPINKLSDEVLLNIFSYLDITTLVISVSIVCKSWYNLAQDHSLWKTLNFTNDGKEIYKFLQQILDKSPFIQNLYVHSTLIKSDLTVIAQTSKQIRKLSLKFCDIPLENQINFEELVKNCKQLIDIDLEGSKVPREILCSLSGALELRILNLSHCVNLDDKILIAICKNCQFLEVLNIDGINLIKDYSVYALINLRFDTLQSVLLDGECLTDSPFYSIGKCSKLKQLSMSFCQELTDKALNRFQSLSQLEFLKLRKGVQLSARGLQEMFLDRKLSCLTHLNLGECSLLDDFALIAVADGCPNLRFLGLQWCWEVTDDGITHIVKKCSSMRVLDLVGLVRMLGHFLRDIKDQVPHLRVLDLEQCGCIDDEVLEELATERPNLRIFNYWGDVVLPK